VQERTLLCLDENKQQLKAERVAISNSLVVATGRSPQFIAAVQGKVSTVLRWVQRCDCGCQQDDGNSRAKHTSHCGSAKHNTLQLCNQHAPGANDKGPLQQQRLCAYAKHCSKRNNVNAAE
jgi:hypothetical protein